MEGGEREGHWREMERRYPDSAIHRALGLTLRVVREGETIVDFDGSANAGNRSGHASGGALATMIDSAVMQACHTVLGPGDRIVTLELNVTFIRPGGNGVRLAAHGRLDHIGRSVAVGHARIEDPDGHLVALGLVTGSVQRASTAPEVAP